MLRLGSLFDGIGGWQLAATHNGVTPVWSSEIEKFPLAVTKIRFPNTKQLGDINNINVDEIEPCEIVCAGSPCQDLSIAGKRGGLAGERSGLFIRAIDIVRRMRDRTGGKFPRWFIWENVTGAFSSNSGNDFRTVLEKIGQTSIPMPPNGKWAKAGLVECEECEIAWRVLDSQYWGVPQRRSRIFLVADFTRGKRRAREVLFVEPCLSGNLGQSEKAQQGVARGTESSTGNTGETIILQQHRSEIRVKRDTKTPTLKADMGTGGNNMPLIFNDQGGSVMKVESDNKVGTLRAEAHGNNPIVLESNQNHATVTNNGICPTLSASMGMGGGYVPMVVPDKAGTLVAGYAKCYNDNPIERGYCVLSKQYLRAEENPDVAGTLTANDYKEPPVVCIGNGQVDQLKMNSVVGALNCMHDQQAVMCHNLIRRLTPLECERLQGLPDNWTLINDKSCSDSARYRAIGNGMAQPCADFIVRRIVEVERRIP